MQRAAGVPETSALRFKRRESLETGGAPLDQPEDFSAARSLIVIMVSGSCRPSQGDSATLPRGRAGITVTRSERHALWRTTIWPPGYHV
jgi:hypothetical protein